MSLPLCLSVPLMEGFPLLTIPSPRHRPPASPQYLKLLLHVRDACGLGVTASPWRVTLRLQVLLSPFSLDSRQGWHLSLW